MTERMFARYARAARIGIPLAAAFLFVSAASGTAEAQSYPSQGIKIIIPFGAGGAVDLVGRPFAQKLSEIIGQSVIIENRAGAGSLIGIMAASKAPPDGYTMLMTTGSMIATPLINPNAGYDPLRDLIPVTQLVYSRGTILATRPDFPAKDLPGLVDLVKESPNKYSYAHTGVGTPAYVAPELFRRYAGLDLVPVPYKGTGNVLTDVIAGQVDMTFSGIPSVLDFARGGKVKALASTGIKRSAVLPNVPTFQELGYQDMDIRGYYGLWFPAGTPPELIKFMHAAAIKALQEPELKLIYEKGALEIIGSSPDEFGAFVAKDFERQKQIVKMLGLAPKQ